MSMDPVPGSGHGIVGLIAWREACPDEIALSNLFSISQIIS
tara:strand:- start:177 stop:299 length:123 start_codon:yes stop_codon:yes gene_type:complete